MSTLAKISDTHIGMLEHDLRKESKFYIFVGLERNTI